MDQDSDLLRTFAETRSEAAFAELVRRHLNLVFSVATRQVGGDVSLAQDVTQQVFTALATKAGQLVDRPTLGGWLYKTALYEATDVVRSERRRRVREQEAIAMNIDADGGEHIDWDRARPLLDEAIAELNDQDRDGVFLRFFEDRPFAEIGTRLGLTENAARMRVERALERLQRSLEQRGITSTSAAVAVALTGQSAAAVPAGLTAIVTSSATLGAASVATASGILAFMSATKVTLGITAALVLAATLTFMSGVKMRRDAAASLAGGAAERAVLQQKLNESAAAIAALRSEVSSLQGSLAARGPSTVAAPTQSQRVTGPGGPGWQPVSDWGNRGNATPAAAIETWLWADVNNRPDVWLTAVRFSEVARQKIAAVYQSLPESERLKFPTPEAMYASMHMANHPYSWTGMRVLPPEMQTPESAVVAYEHQWSDGRFRTNRIQLHLYQDGWKMPISDESVEAVLKSYGLRRASEKK